MAVRFGRRFASILSRQLVAVRHAPNVLQSSIHSRSHRLWSPDEDKMLLQLRYQGRSFEETFSTLEHSRGGRSMLCTTVGDKRPKETRMAGSPFQVALVQQISEKFPSCVTKT
ncbi:hypothetical protein EJ03DRAFT_14836 [Teratosphaeria nubilosa]|uniref:Myb-like domain-containing protein n=1 Tax=Teratosphaeria nubilosa TaxID=161662 RepID=A0A6G1KX07_9PEZI|nr:hypothetical protein EJ03DRAFT_14836 [Teratosphaeria nubilosa]